MDSTQEGVNSDGSLASPERREWPSLDALFLAKQERRRALARLPIEQKVRIVVELQKIDQAIRAATGRPSRHPWHVPWNI